MGHVNFALRKHVHPIAQLQFIDARVYRGLKDATATDTGNALAVHEEGGVRFVGETNVVGGQGPANALRAANVLQGQNTWNKQKPIIILESESVCHDIEFVLILFVDE